MMHSKLKLVIITKSAIFFEYKFPVTPNFLPSPGHHKELLLDTLCGESTPNLGGLWDLCAVVGDNGLDGLAKGAALVLQKVGLWQEQEFSLVSKALFEQLVKLSYCLWKKSYVDGGLELIEDRDEGIRLDGNAIAELVDLEVQEVHKDLLIDEEL
jgi:hypothetical protein